MKELFYFCFADLMAGISYQKETNSLRYATHRKMAFAERLIIEQFLLAEFAPRTEYYKRQPACFAYLGIDPPLAKALENFHLNSASRKLEAKEVSDSVSNLISRSLRSYYFEQIGDVILEARREMADRVSGDADQRRGGLQYSFEYANTGRSRRKMKLEELVKAYNAYADQKVTIDEIIPSELKSYFGMPVGNEYVRS